MPRREKEGGRWGEEEGAGRGVWNTWCNSPLINRQEASERASEHACTHWNSSHRVVVHIIIHSRTFLPFPDVPFPFCSLSIWWARRCVRIQRRASTILHAHHQQIIRFQPSSNDRLAFRVLFHPNFTQLPGQIDVRLVVHKLERDTSTQITRGKQKLNFDSQVGYYYLL